MPTPENIFKAYDVRGIYPSEINEKIAARIAGVLANYFKTKSRNPKIVVGRDTRLSSPALYQAVLDGVKRQASSVKIIEAGMITTPMLYFLVNHFKTAGGIMITASHNPKQYNGLKAVSSEAAPISGKEIERLIYGLR